MRRKPFIAFSCVAAVTQLCPRRQNCVNTTTTVAMYVRNDEMKLKQNSFKTVLELFCFRFILLCGQFNTLQVVLLLLGAGCRVGIFHR